MLFRKLRHYERVKGEILMNHVKKYEKLPIVVEAIPLIKGLFPEIREFIGDAFVKTCYLEPDGTPTEKPTETWGMIIKTLEGEMVGTENDFVIKGKVGEFYFCKPHVFYQTYKLYKEPEEVPEAAEDEKENM